MAVKQIYTIINSVVNQGLGSTALTTVDEQGLISLGKEVLSSATNTNNFINTLVDLIGRDIISGRKYTSKFSGIYRSNFDYGLFLRKITVEMPDAEADQSVDLNDGNSVDMYKIKKPKADQKIFGTKTPWQIMITIQRKHLKNAFHSESEMETFINSVYLQVQNKIELIMDDMGRNCINNYMAEVSDKDTRAINLLTLFNTKSGKKLTSANCLFDAQFLRFCTAQINLISKKMTDMSVLYNDGTLKRHTPKEYQRLYVLDDFEETLNSEMLSGAFHDGYVKLPGYDTVSYWQSAQKPNEIDITRASDGGNKKVSGIVACLFDIEALGTYREDEWSSTTPFNSAGGYWNTYWHFEKAWFNDLSENFVMFYIADTPEAA